MATNTDKGPSEALPPAYSASEQSSDARIRLEIVKHRDTSATDAVTGSIEVSCAQSAQQSTAWGTARKYDLSLNSRAKELLITPRDSASKPSIKVTLSKTILFDISHGNNNHTFFRLSEFHVPVTKYQDPNTLIEQMPQIPLDLHNAGTLQPFTWRASPSQRASKRSDQSVDDAEASNSTRAIDLVLLDQKFQQVAYFENEFDPLENGKVQAWGTLEVKRGIDDAIFVEQIVLSLLAIIEAHVWISAKGSVRSDFGEKVLSSALLCSVM